MLLELRVTAAVLIMKFHECRTIKYNMRLEYCYNNKKITAAHDVMPAGARSKRV